MVFKQGLKKLNQWFIVQERGLTLGEIQLIESVFSDQIQQLDHIRIIAHRAILKDYALSPNGHIYFNAHNWRPDFSTADVHIQAWLIHEMVHVWQLQQGIRVVRKAILNRRYRYILQAGKHFLSYGVEQQAQMVQDYFIRKKSGQICTEYEKCIPFVPPQIQT